MKSLTAENKQESSRASGLDRREFIARLLKTMAGITGLGFLAYYFHSPNPPYISHDDATLKGFADFSIPSLSGRLCIVKNVHDRQESLRIAIKALGGMEAFIRRGDRVLIKVNAAFATPPALSATTHPELVEEMIRLCRSAGAVSVIVADNPINDPASCFSLTGIQHAARQAGADIVMPFKSRFRSMSLTGGTLIKEWPVFYEPFAGVQKVIALAPLKDHHRSGASMIMKNWYGVLGGRRNVFHQNIHEIIMELAMLVKPTLAVLDATTAMMKNGPTGGSMSDLKETRTMIAGTDQVAVDAAGATVLERSVESLPHILKAHAKGLGTSDWKSLFPGLISAS
jgi:uncharacterized protein (DUF362 family)